MRHTKTLIVTVFISLLVIIVADAYAWNPLSSIDFTKLEEIEKIKNKSSLKEDPEIQTAYKKLLLSYISAEEQRLIEERSVILQTNRISYFIFFITHLFLVFGIYAAYTEFKSSNRMRKEGVDIELQEIKLGLEGVALKTSLHGTLILSITMVFYYLYLVHVYPIVIVGAPS